MASVRDLVYALPEEDRLQILLEAEALEAQGFIGTSALRSVAEQAEAQQDSGQTWKWLAAVVHETHRYYALEYASQLPAGVRDGPGGILATHFLLRSQTQR